MRLDVLTPARRWIANRLGRALLGGADGGVAIGPKLVDGYERRAPSGQNAVDLVPGWSSALPAPLALEAGTVPLYDDGRLAWAMECFGPLAGRRVLELGPLEGGHTYMLDRAGALVDAVEANGLAYVKCLIAKEITGIRNARTHLGDFNLWLDEQDVRYDLIVASGVLYHMRDPLALLRRIRRRSDAVFLWTMFVDDDAWEPSEVQDLDGLPVRLYRVPYPGQRLAAFCGGPHADALWINRHDLLAAMGRLGYGRVLVAHEERIPYGWSGSIYASVD